MSGMGVELYVRRIGEGDKDELFYELKEALMKSLWAKCKRVSTGSMKSYLNSEDVHTFMSDRADGAGENTVLFAFWDVDGTTQDLAVHGFEIMIALDAKRLDKICRQRGHAVELEKHPLEPLLTDVHAPMFAMTGTSSHNRVMKWRRERDADAEPDLKYPMKSATPADLARIRAMAMTGWCSCDICLVVRKRKKMDEPMLDANVALAWALLAEPRGAELAGAAQDDATRSVLGDWLEQNGAAISKQLLPGLVRTYYGR